MNEYIINDKIIAELIDYSNAEDAEACIRNIIDTKVRSHPYQSEWDTVLTTLHNWFENYCEDNEEPDLWMAFINAERAIRQAGEHGNDKPTTDKS